MTRFLALIALLALCAQYIIADTKVNSDSFEIKEETVDPINAENEKPNIPMEVFQKVFSKLSNKCQKEIEANPSKPEDLSDRCRMEFGKKLQRALEREKEGPKKPKKDKSTEKKPKKTKKKRKQSRAEREAAAGRKKQEEYNQTVTVIVGFVATMIAVVIGAVCVINRKLKAAGMYYPANPEEKATGGCCG